MVDDISSRSVQTKVKHRLLEKYIGNWGGIILNGLSNKITDTHFVYVDCNSSFGRYEGEEDDLGNYDRKLVAYGSPIIGIRSLDKLIQFAQKKNINLRTNAILIEILSNRYTELKKSLKMAGYENRIKETSDFNSLQNHEIALVCCDATELTDSLIAYTQDENKSKKFSIYFLDPYGPKALPLHNYVDAIICQPRHDVIINMPYQDLHKKTGLVVKENLSGEEKKLLKNYDLMFGNENWRNIVGRLAHDASWKENLDLLYENNSGTATDLELELVQCYKNTLQTADCELSVKSIGLRFPDRERTMFYLYLTTHDPDGALAMNKVLYDAGYQEHELRWRLWELKTKPPEQPMLFNMPIPKYKNITRPTIEVVSNHIYNQFKGLVVTRKQIYQEFADEIYFVNEINKAITDLKKKALINCPPGQIKNNTLISFSK